MKRKHLVLLILCTIILPACNNTDTGVINENFSYWNGYYYKSVGEVDERSIEWYCEKFQAMYDMYFTKEMNVYFTVVPNKSLYTNKIGKEFHDKIVEIVCERITAAKYIELADTLSLDSYYKTDDHWRQECLTSLVNRLGESMNFTIDFTKFTETRYDKFIGAYNSQIDGLLTELLTYMKSDYTENAVVDNMQHPDITFIYDVDKLETENKYDIYLSGVSPIIVITNDLVETERELIIFRDSFASSITPLLLEAYSKITLIDSRFILMDLIGDYVEFNNNNQDVLFIHSDLIINNSLLLK